MNVAALLALTQVLSCHEPRNHKLFDQIETDREVC